MLTVLVRKPNGHEDIYACDTVHKEPHALLMRGDTLGNGDSKGLEILGPQGQTLAWNGNRGADVLRTPDEKSADVYVMNSSGKTIAVYTL